jgi:hypothetical protein
MAAVQFVCHPRTSAFCAVKDLGGPRHASRFLRNSKRAFGSRLYSNCTTIVLIKISNTIEVALAASNLHRTVVLEIREE